MLVVGTTDASGKFSGFSIPKKFSFPALVSVNRTDGGDSISVIVPVHCPQRRHSRKGGNQVASACLDPRFRGDDGPCTALTFRFFLLPWGPERLPLRGVPTTNTSCCCLWMSDGTMLH